MGRDVPAWSAGAVAAVSTIGSAVLDVLLASRISEDESARSLQALLYAGFALQITALGCLCYYCVLFARTGIKHRILWADPSAGAGFNAVAMAVGGVALIWLACRPSILRKADQKLFDAGLTLWVFAIATQFAFFVLIRWRLRQSLKHLRQRAGSTKFGITLPPNHELAIGTRPSFCSRGTTLASSRPCTPLSSRTFSLHSSTTKIGSSVRSKLTRTSARSSLELPPFPAGEATTVGSAFDRYDTSSIAYDMRTTVLTPSNMARSGLEPIPGSRSGSPEQDSSPILPSSPAIREMPQSPLLRKSQSHAHVPSKSKSSPPNFSRPTSRAQDRNMGSPTPVRQTRVSASMTDLIHPLFRPDSPAPPQILTSTTMVTASPLANQPITPKTLNRLRSTSDLQARRSDREQTSAGPLALTSRGEWRVIPPQDATLTRLRSRSHSSLVGALRSGTSGSESGSSIRLQKTNSIGSPGPSIIEEDELPPILPGFVLSAGSRSSLVGYGKRKSTKRSSAHLE